MTKNSMDNFIDNIISSNNAKPEGFTPKPRSPKPESTKKSKKSAGIQLIQFKRNLTCLVQSPLVQSPLVQSPLVQSPLSNFNFLDLKDDIYEAPIFTPPLPICANEPNKFQSKPIDLLIDREVQSKLS